MSAENPVVLSWEVLTWRNESDYTTPTWENLKTSGEGRLYSNVLWWIHDLIKRIEETNVLDSLDKAYKLFSDIISFLNDSLRLFKNLREEKPSFSSQGKGFDEMEELRKIIEYFEKKLKLLYDSIQNLEWGDELKVYCRDDWSKYWVEKEWMIPALIWELTQDWEITSSREITNQEGMWPIPQALIWVRDTALSILHSVKELTHNDGITRVHDSSHKLPATAVVDFMYDVAKWAIWSLLWQDRRTLELSTSKRVDYKSIREQVGTIAQEMERNILWKIESEEGKKLLWDENQANIFLQELLGTCLEKYPLPKGLTISYDVDNRYAPNMEGFFKNFHFTLTLDFGCILPEWIERIAIDLWVIKFPLTLPRDGAQWGNTSIMCRFSVVVKHKIEATSLLKKWDIDRLPQIVDLFSIASEYVESTVMYEYIRGNEILNRLYHIAITGSLETIWDMSFRMRNSRPNTPSMNQFKYVVSERKAVIQKIYALKDNIEMLCNMCDEKTLLTHIEDSMVGKEGVSLEEIWEIIKILNYEYILLPDSIERQHLKVVDYLTRSTSHNKRQKTLMNLRTRDRREYYAAWSEEWGKKSYFITYSWVTEGGDIIDPILYIGFSWSGENLWMYYWEQNIKNFMDNFIWSGVKKKIQNRNAVKKDAFFPSLMYYLSTNSAFQEDSLYVKRSRDEKSEVCSISVRYNGEVINLSIENNALKISYQKDTAFWIQEKKKVQTLIDTWVLSVLEQQNKKLL